MDTLLFHPKLVHLPIALGALMPVVAGGIALAWWRKWLPSRAWVVVVALQAVLVASGFAALQSGEAEEERVEHVVPESVLEAHEDAAASFAWTSAGVLALAVMALIAHRRRRSALPLAAAVTLGALVVLGLGYRTGEAGGALVYRHGAARVYAGDSAGTSALPHDDGDDD